MDPRQKPNLPSPRDGPAYTNVIGARRASWRIISSMEQNQGSRVTVIRDYKSNIGAEMSEICSRLLSLLVNSTASSASSDCYNKMSLDCKKILQELKVSQDTCANLFSLPFLQEGGQNSLFKAKLAEKSKRYDEMLTWMEELSTARDELKDEERLLLSVAFKNVIGARRASMRMLSSMEETIREYKSNIEDELSGICNRLRKIHYRRPAVTSTDANQFYEDMLIYLDEDVTIPDVPIGLLNFDVFGGEGPQNNFADHLYELLHKVPRTTVVTFPELGNFRVFHVPWDKFVFELRFLTHIQQIRRWSNASLRLTRFSMCLKKTVPSF